MAIYLLVLMLLSGCSMTVRKVEREEMPQGELRVNCRTPIYTEGFYCDDERTKSSLLQPWSKVKITNMKNGKSITVAVMRDDDIKGVCIPKRYSHILGPATFPAKLDIERCGREGITTCPKSIEGMASYYANPYHGRESAYGTTYNMYGMYAAHRTLPLGTLLKVVNLENNKFVVVKVIDRGPFKNHRVLDLSYGAAKEIDMIKKGEAKVIAYVIRCGE
ncbi:MAG: septal ring lytic transglycosylase RlpA family protein [Aquificaceae bacterium]